jgi:transposase|tara:strand:+ start:144 stop:566 length:423 start_codon:yes stop_codon:yes gene_type:complete
MGAPYSQDLRDRVLAAYDRGMKTKQIADVFTVSPAWARRVKQRRRETGETTPRPMGGATVIKIDMDRLAALVREQPDATGRELHQRLGADCCESAIYIALKRLGLTFKKRRFTQRNKIARMSLSVASDGKAISRRSMDSS